MTRETVLIEVEVPVEMVDELEGTLPDYYPIEEWSRGQIVPSIAQFVETNRQPGGQGMASAPDLDELAEEFDEDDDEENLEEDEE